MTYPNFRDMENLSAYLDGQISLSERTRLEKRIQSDAALAAALQRLRQARTLLQRTPKPGWTPFFRGGFTNAGTPSLRFRRRPASRRPHGLEQSCTCHQCTCYCLLADDILSTSLHEFFRYRLLPVGSPRV